MQLIRRVMLVLLVISLPSYGWAFTGMPACSMQHSLQPMQQAQHMQHGQMATTHSADCCADQLPKHANNSFDHDCGGGLQCHCSALYQALQPLTALVTPVTHSVIQSPPFHLITTIALPLWRPPTLS